MTPRRSGSIVNISSILGLMPSAGAPHYSTAKAAIIALTKSVADEVSGLGIRVNAVCPGYIDTPLLTPFSEQMKAAITLRIGMGRMGEPTDIAEMIRFLAGPESKYCTGDVFKVSGGYLG
jgi:3-oxoacyl-[acyl-carrier protein] reductase